MNKIFHLSSCNTCQRILKELDAENRGITLQDVKVQNVSAEELDVMAKKIGSYEALFSRRAMKFRSMGLAEMDLGEADYRRLIIEEYTFLKRPVLLTDDAVFAGSAKASVEGARAALKG